MEKLLLQLKKKGFIFLVITLLTITYILEKYSMNHQDVLKPFFPLPNSKFSSTIPGTSMFLSPLREMSDE